MHHLLQAASTYLAQHDADALERVLQQVQTSNVLPEDTDRESLKREAYVLQQQVLAAELHLGIASSRRGAAWAR